MLKPLLCAATLLTAATLLAQQPPAALVGADCEAAAVQLAPLWGDLDGFREQFIGDGLRVATQLHHVLAQELLCLFFLLRSWLG